MKVELEKLVALQYADSQIKTLKHALDTVSQRRDGLEQEFEARAFEIRAVEKQRDTAVAERVQLETQLAEASQNLERSERNLKAAQNQKQYEASMREKGVFQKQIDDFNTQIIEKMGVIETVENTLSERAEEIAGLDADHATRLKAFEAEINAQKKDLEKYTEEREKAVATLPKNLSAMYNRLVTRIRDGVAVAEVKNGACSACFMSLRPQMLVDIRLGEKIIACENCNRILFLVAAEPAAETQPSAAGA